MRLVVQLACLQHRTVAPTQPRGPHPRRRSHPRRPSPRPPKRLTRLRTPFCHRGWPLGGPLTVAERCGWYSWGMALDSQLLEILACPQDKGPLLYFEDEGLLYNQRLKRSYAIVDDIPVMLIDEASDVEETEHERLLAKAETEGITPTF